MMLNRTLLVLSAIALTACEPPAPKVDMKTIVDVPEGQPAPRLGEILGTPTIDYAALDVQTLSGRGNCAVPRPSAGAKIVNITSYTSGTQKDSPIHAMHARQDQDTGEWDVGSDPYHRSKIVITDISAPIYVIAGTYEATVWEIHTAPGAKLDGIALIGHETQAVVNSNLPKHRVGFVSRSDPKQRKCYVKAKYKPVKTDPSKRVKSAQNLSQREEKRMKDRSRAKTQEWRKWVAFQRKALGRGADVRISGYGVNTSLIGEVPFSPLDATYTDNTLYRHSADDRTLLVTDYDSAIAQAESWIAMGRTDF